MHFSELISISEQEEDPWSICDYTHHLETCSSDWRKLFLTLGSVETERGLGCIFSRGFMGLTETSEWFPSTTQTHRVTQSKSWKIVLTAATFLRQPTREISTFCSFSRNIHNAIQSQLPYIERCVLTSEEKTLFYILVEYISALTSFTQSAHHHRPSEWAIAHKKHEANTLMKTKRKEVSVFCSLWTSSVRF